MNRNDYKKTTKLILLVLLGFSLVSSVFGSSVMWSQIYNTAEGGMPYALVETSDGGYAIAGGQYDLGVVWDFCLAKTDENGSMQWSQSYGGKSMDMANSLIESVDGGYALVGYTESFGAGSSDFWLIKTDANGSMLWNRTYGGPEWDSAYSLVETPDEGYILAGWTKSFGSGDYDCWLIKTDSNGNIEWNQTIGGVASDVAWSLVKTFDGGYAIAGATKSYGTESYDCWLIKTDEYGNPEWNQTYGGTEIDYAYSLVETSDSGYALAGMTESFGAGKADVWLIKTDSQGNMMWNQTFGEDEPDEANSLVQTSDDGYILAGYKTTGNATENPFHVEDFWLIKTDETGIALWNYTYGSDWDDRAQSIIETFDGGYALVGYSMPGAKMNFLVIKTNEYGNIPEFPSWTMLPIFLVAILSVIVARRKFFT